MIEFGRLECTDEVRAAFAACEAGAGCELGRVTSLDRGYPLVNTRDAELRAELATNIKKRDDSIVAVGDWVALRVEPGHEKAIIAEILPRRVELARVKRVGRAGQVRRQVLAANVDMVLVCHPLGAAGLDGRLVERQVAAVYGCGARPALVLTKADAAGAADVDAAAGQVHAVFPELDVACAGTGDCEQVRALVAPSTTALLLGESGVGKSTLVNALVGAAALATGAVRERDGKGRHTTVARRMLEVPGGGLVIDAPGLRTLQVLDPAASARATFPDIVELAARCRFRDCTHRDEPGCAVRGAVAPQRLEAYLRLVQAAQASSR